MALAEDYTFQYKSTGFVLNTEATGTGSFVDVHKVVGLDSAELDVNERGHSGMDGGIVEAEYEDVRTVIIDGTLYSSQQDHETTLDTLKANYAPSRTSSPFYLRAPGVEERVIFAKSLGIKYPWDVVRRLGITPIQIQLKAEDSSIYGPEVGLTIGLASPGNGRGYNKAFPYGYLNVATPPPDTPPPAPVLPPEGDSTATEADPGGTGDPAVTQDTANPLPAPPAPTSTNVTADPSGGTNNAYNAGNKPTPGIIRFYGPVRDPGLISDTADKVLQFTITLAEGEFLELNLRTHTVMLNARANRRNAMTPNSRWFLFQPGNNLLRYIGYPTSQTVATYATVTYRHAYR